MHLVHTKGENKGGMDKEARVTVHVPGHPALHVTETSDEIHRAIAAAAIASSGRRRSTWSADTITPGRRSQISPPREADDTRGRS